MNDKNYIYILILVDFMVVKKAYLLSYKKPLFARVNWTEWILRYKAWAGKWVQRIYECQ